MDDPVYVFNLSRTSKLDKRWKPYYRVVEQITPVNYLVRHAITGAMKKVHKVHLRKATLEWEIPEAPRPYRKAQLAAPVDSEREDRSQTLTDSEDIPLARLRERMTSDSFSDSDNIPLARLREQYSDTEATLSTADPNVEQPAPLQSDIVTDTSTDSEFSDVGMDIQRTKRYRSSDSSPQETSEAKRL